MTKVRAFLSESEVDTCAFGVTMTDEAAEAVVVVAVVEIVD